MQVFRTTIMSAYQFGKLILLYIPGVTWALLTSNKVRSIQFSAKFTSLQHGNKSEKMGNKGLARLLGHGELLF